MRAFFKTFAVSLAAFASLASYGQLVANSRYLENSTQALKQWAAAKSLPAPEAFSSLIREARQRAKMYDDAIVKDHLVDGMVVNRTLDTGEMRDQCDSLLFSSLRYVSLTKLKDRLRAIDAWQAIERSQNNGHWLRHPRCLQSTSRDMVLGLLAAMSQRPPGFEKHLSLLMEKVDRSGGYFSTGPIYVSYLSPGLARFMAVLARNRGIHSTQIPAFMQDAYSTAELEVMVTEPGFTSHLGALTAWLEMEIGADPLPVVGEPNAIHFAIDRLVAPFAVPSLTEQRLEWITANLVRNDPENLFFRYLRLRASNALTPAVRVGLLAELLALPQFPATRLPMDCDRHADYLWQRAWHEVASHEERCTERYNGTDFLWMTSLLLEGLEPSEGSFYR